MGVLVSTPGDTGEFAFAAGELRLAARKLVILVVVRERPRPPVGRVMGWVGGGGAGRLESVSSSSPIVSESVEDFCESGGLTPIGGGVDDGGRGEGVLRRFTFSFSSSSS